MFVSDKLIFLELHKTAGTHIGKLLQKLVSGEQVGKHNRVPPDLRDRFILGSIRNPWDWYVSLWGYGCDGLGSVYFQTTRRSTFKYYWEQLPNEMGLKYPTLNVFTRQLIANIQKPLTEWKSCYRDSGDPSCFRKWLKLVLSRDRRFDIGEGYGFSPVSSHYGLLTYRFLKIFTSLDEELYSKKLKYELSDLITIWNDYRITNYIIRNEYLELDLIDAIRKVGIELDEERKEDILKAQVNKTNTSSRKETSFYYDNESIELIKEKEMLIIELFGYKQPS